MPREICLVHNRRGAMHEGTLYELSPSSSGGTESILHNFPSSGNDGASPQTGVLVGRTQSQLYGSTMTGGSDGSIYRLWFNNRHWVEKRMHDNGGEQTGGDLVMDRNLNVYGATNNAAANAT